MKFKLSGLLTFEGWLIFACLISFCIIMGLAGCYTAKKAEQQVNKADSKFPEVVAKLARDKYPCTDLLKPDTAILYKDTTVYIDCPDSIQATYEVVRTDTVNNTVVRTVRVPVNIQLPGRTITRWYEDSAKLKLAAVEYNRVVKANEGLQAKNEKLSGKLKHARTENWIWRLIASALIIWQLFKLYKRFTTLKIF